MPIRIDHRLFEHPKVIRAAKLFGRFGWERTIAYYVLGLEIATDYATDGLLPIDLLQRYLPTTKCATVCRVMTHSAVALWTQSEAGPVIHDFHDYNPNSKQVKSYRKRIGSKNGWSDESLSYETGNSIGLKSNGITHNRSTSRSRSTERPPCRSVSLENATDKNPKKTDEPLTEIETRAARFVERYAEIFREVKLGARYLSRPTLDYQHALALVQLWDDERLELLVRVFLLTDDPYCRNGAGNIAHFKSRASWCDGKLRENKL